MDDTEKKKMFLLLGLVIIVNIYFVSRISKHEGFGTNIVTSFVKKGINAIPNKSVKKFLKSSTKKSTDETILNDIGFSLFKLTAIVTIIPYLIIGILGFILIVIFDTSIKNGPDVLNKIALFSTNIFT